MLAGLRSRAPFHLAWLFHGAYLRVVGLFSRALCVGKAPRETQREGERSVKRDSARARTRERERASERASERVGTRERERAREWARESERVGTRERERAREWARERECVRERENLEQRQADEAPRVYTARTAQRRHGAHHLHQTKAIPLQVKSKARTTSTRLKLYPCTPTPRRFLRARFGWNGALLWVSFARCRPLLQGSFAAPAGPALAHLRRCCSSPAAPRKQRAI